MLKNSWKIFVHCDKPNFLLWDSTYLHIPDVLQTTLQVGTGRQTHASSKIIKQVQILATKTTAEDRRKCLAPHLPQIIFIGHKYNFLC